MVQSKIIVDLKLSLTRAYMYMYVVRGQCWNTQGSTWICVIERQWVKKLEPKLGPN